MEEISEMAAPDFDDIVEQSHRAWGEFVRGNPEPAMTLFSNREDVTLGNPFGPFARGWEQVAATLERAASKYRDGQVSGFESVAKNVAPDLGYIVEVERYRAKIGGRADLTPVALRVTSILRREAGIWRIVHRHADPITTVQPAESVIQG
jgi:ketosteroid isomerase-like protein